MASYAMCHMKLDMILTELGYQPINTTATVGLLTNSLEKASPQTRRYLYPVASREAKVNAIKRDMPIACVEIRRTTYSKNKNDWSRNS